MLLGKTALLKKCKCTGNRIRNQDFELVSLTKEFMTDLRGESRRKNISMLEIKEKKEEKVFFKGEEITRYTQNDGTMEWSDIWYRNRQDRRIGRTSITPLDKTKGLVIREEKNIQFLLAVTGIDRRFLMAVPNDTTREIIIYDLGQPDPDDFVGKKLRKIILWAQANKEFDSSFVHQLYSLKEKGHQLTPAQEKALDNIIEKWRIP